MKQDEIATKLIELENRISKLENKTVVKEDTIKSKDVNYKKPKNSKKNFSETNSDSTIVESNPLVDKDIQTVE